MLLVNKDSFKTEVEEAKGLVVIDFYADWCGPCRMVAPIIEEIANERSDVAVAKVNVDENPDLAGKFGVASIPTLVVIRNGKIASRSVGARPKDQILDMLDR